MESPQGVAAYKLDPAVSIDAAPGNRIECAAGLAGVRMDELLRATARAEARHFWFRGFRWFVTPLVRRALAGRSSARLLDCGCGTGANLDLLARYGSAYGFDRSAVGLQFARRSGKRRIARATVAAAPFPDDAFDLVASFDVLY